MYYNCYYSTPPPPPTRRDTPVLYTRNMSLLAQIIGYRGKGRIVWASNTKISLTYENATSPNEKLLAIG